MADSVKFEHYEVLKRDDGSLFELGRGAMGVTYKAFDTSLHCEVALKVIAASYLDSEVARQRFIREARAAARLRHRNVATVFHLGEEEGAYFYAMEFIDGETVENLIKRTGPLDPLLALQITSQVARALNAAHAEQLVHRDIKPANLMIVQEDGDVVVKVIDFGLAKSVRVEDGEEAATVSMGGFVGTPHFASPEQLEERDLDVRSDIYSLGATLWYMLAGRAPFSGTMAQVMSQHLSAQPPFHLFGNWPPPIVELLRCMLEKEATQRPQTPLELRQRIEKCMESLAGPASQQEFATLTSLPEADHSAGVATGTILAGRYQILQDLGDGSAGQHFLAERDGRKLRLVLLPPNLSGEALGHLESAVEKLKGQTHPNLLETLGLESARGRCFLVFGWNEGFTLTDLLRSRRELSSAETLILLRQAAAGVDFALKNEVASLDLALHHLFLDFPGNTPPQPQQPLRAWPEFQLKLMPVSVLRELSTTETWAGGVTMDAGLARGNAVANLPTPVRYLTLLGALVYEWLGGAGSRSSSRYVPLASLSEGGNEVLKRCLNPATTFASASEFTEALAAAEAGRIVAEPKPKTQVAESASPNRLSSAATPIQKPTPPPAPTTPASKALPLIPIGAAIALALIGGGAYFVANRSKPVAATHSEATPTPAAIAAPATPVPVATPDLAVSTPSPEPTPTPQPTANPREVALKEQLQEAAKAEEDRDWAKALDAYANLARNFPESEAGRVRLGIIAERLRTAQPKLTETEIVALRPSLEKAAALDVVPAMMLLGEGLRRTEPDSAFAWYCAAAERGNAAASTQVGLIYSNGAGTVPKDLGKAIWWFQQAADGRDTTAITLLAECHLYGKGVPKDEAKAVDLLKEAVANGDPRAMDLLGKCYHQGLGTAKNFPEALQLFTAASDKGFTDSLGNIGVLYMNGDGVPQDQRKAASLFQKGAASGSAYCMFQYARCLEGGFGTEQNRLAAESWYVKAAAAGHVKALEWCKKNGVTVPTK